MSKQATMSTLSRIKVTENRVFSLIAVAERDGSESYRYIEQAIVDGVPYDICYESAFWDRDAAYRFFDDIHFVKPETTDRALATLERFGF